MTLPLLEVRDLSVTFPLQRGVLRHRRHFTAVDGISFTVRPSETLAIVGESGSGKSTTGYAILGLVRPSGGKILFNGIDLASLDRVGRLEMARHIQIIYQDPSAALDPRFTIARSIGEPLLLHSLGSASDRARRVNELLDAVGLAPEIAGRFPNQISGGQRQRAVIARALALNPRLIVCDEAVSALDVSIRSQILNLLMDLQASFGLSYLFISHDLSVVRHISDRVIVINSGRIVEEGDTDSIFSNPLHDYTKALIAAIPIPDPSRRRRRPLRPD